MAPADVAHGRCDKNGQYGAGHDVAEKELAYGLARVESIDNKDNAGRYEDTQCRTCRYRACIEHRVVVVFFHGGNRYLTHSGRCRGVAAADRRKSSARHDGGNCEPTLVMAEPSV